MQKKFNISISKKGMVGFIILFVLIQTGLFLMSFETDFGLPGKVLSIVFLIVCLTALLQPLLFKVEVRDTNISVRTKIGICFSFDISEIKKVDCNLDYSEQKQRVGTITIKTASKILVIDQKMNGFQEMAEYILDKLDRGEINENAISVNCKRSLSKCAVDKKL